VQEEAREYGKVPSIGEHTDEVLAEFCVLGQDA
jgi:hypothetical protein